MDHDIVGELAEDLLHHFHDIGVANKAQMSLVGVGDLGGGQLRPLADVVGKSEGVVGAGSL